MLDCYEYVRDTYKVPAFVGVKVIHTDGKKVARSGVIIKARKNLNYIHVRLDGYKHPVMFHPTDLEYVTTDKNTADTAERVAFLRGIEIALLVGQGIKPENAWSHYKRGSLPRTPGELQDLERAQSLLVCA